MKHHSFLVFGLTLNPNKCNATQACKHAMQLKYANMQYNRTSMQTTCEGQVCNNMQGNILKLPILRACILSAKQQHGIHNANNNIAYTMQYNMSMLSKLIACILNAKQYK